MNFATKTVLAATALGLAASPAAAQVGGYDRAPGYDRSYGDTPRTAPGYDEDGALNVFGARLDPRRANGGLVGGLGTVVGGTVGGVVGAADDITTGSIGGRDVGYTGQRGGRYAR